MYNCAGKNYLIPSPADTQIPPEGKTVTHSTGHPWSMDKTLPWLRKSHNLREWSYEPSKQQIS